MGKKNRILTFEERKAQLLKNNPAPSSGQAVGDRAEAFKQTKIDQLQKQAELAAQEASQPKPKPKAKPKGQVVQLRTRYGSDILKENRSWASQPDADVYWAGMDEQEWANRTTYLDKQLRDHPEWDAARIDSEVDRIFPKMEGDARTRYIKHAQDPRRRVNQPLDMAYAGPHTYGSESQWFRNLERSGWNVGSLTSQLDDVTATDLAVDTEQWDVQNWTNRDGRLGIGIKKGIDNPQIAAEQLRRANAKGMTVGEMVHSIENADRRTSNPRTGRFGRGGLPDKLLESQVRGRYRKDMLIGNVLHRESSNVMGQPQKGSFDPQLGQGEYAIDLRNLHDNVMDEKVSKILGPDGEGIKVSRDGRSVKLRLPYEELQRRSNSKGLIEELVDKDVLDSIDEVAILKGVRDPRATRYHATMLPGADEAVEGLKRNWKGGVAGTVLSGASREGAKKLAQGDVAGAAGEFATNYAIGAVGESALKRAAATGIGKRVVGAAAKRIPAAVSRFAGGTVASGGLAAPALAAWAVADVADGLTEGFTGKGIVTHGREAGERAEQRKA